MLSALVVSDMLPDARHPERGRFVRDQVAALRELDGLEVELFEFAPGARALVSAARALRGRHRDGPVDVVHAHFGLSAWPALAVRARARALTLHGTDVRHPRTRQATRAVLPLMDLVGAASPALLREIPGRRARARAQVLPCGVELARFRPLPREHARAVLGLEPTRPYLLFPADPLRAEKRHDRARAIVDGLQLDGVELLTLGGVEPERVPFFINAANAVVVPSAREGFGLAVLEALACDVPVLATPVGSHAEFLDGIAGTLCAEFDLARWRAVLEPHLRAQDPRIDGRARAEGFSSTRMAERVREAWRALAGRGG